MSSYRGHFSELAPSDQADIASWSEPEDACCDLCGEPNPIDPDAKATTGMWVCVPCIEAMLDAPAVNARAEVGLVGSGGGRS